MGGAFEHEAATVQRVAIGIRALNRDFCISLMFDVCDIPGGIKGHPAYAFLKLGAGLGEFTINGYLHIHPTRGGYVQRIGNKAVAILGESDITKRSGRKGDTGRCPYVVISGCAVELCVDSILAFTDTHLALGNRVFSSGPVHGH